MPPLSLLPDIFVPTFELVLNHVPLPPPVAKLIEDVGVTKHLDPPNSFTFRLNDSTLALVSATGGLFTEGKSVVIRLGVVRATIRLSGSADKGLTGDLPAG